MSDTLDPDDWDAFRTLAHRAVDDMVDYMSTARERPVWRPVPDEVRDSLSGPAPRQGKGEERAKPYIPLSNSTILSAEPDTAIISVVVAYPSAETSKS